MVIGDCWLRIDFEKTTGYVSFEQPEDFLYDYRWQITVNNESGRDQIVGKFHLVYADISNGFEAGLSATDVLDGRASTYEFAPFFDRNGEVKKIIQQKCDHDLFYTNMLMIDRIEILPRFRGQGICRRILKAMINRFGHGASLAVLKAFPLQFETMKPFDSKEIALNKRMQLAGLETNEAEAVKSLIKFYKNLGFKRFQKTNLMFASIVKDF